MECPDVPPLVLDPRATWPKAASYDANAKQLAAFFQKNFEQFGEVSAAVRGAGPLIA